MSSRVISVGTTLKLTGAACPRPVQRVVRPGAWSVARVDTTTDPFLPGTAA